MPAGPAPVLGYTAVLCGDASCAGAGSMPGVADAVRDCVRRSGHGVLVRAGCSFGPTACRLRPSGPIVLVQRCDTERRPVGSAMRIGPVRTADDIDALREWLRAGRLDPALLPPGLVGVHRAVLSAARN